MSCTLLNKNLRKYDDRTLSDLLRNGLLDAADVEIDLEKCIEPLLLDWLVNYDYDTSAQPIGLFFTLLTVLAHVSHNINILQWNKIKKKLNIYSFILGISGACKSGCIRPVRTALTAMIEFLRQYKLGDQNSYNSLVDTFTTAGLYDQLVQSTDVLVLQEEIDTTLHNMGFYVASGNEGRQLLCSLWEGLDDNKKTKGYRQNVRQSHLTICGASTGKSFTPLIRECLDDFPIDGVIDRCLILVVPYSRFTRDLLKPRDLRKPTIAQILLCASILGQRELVFDEEAYNSINTYTDDLTHRAASFYRTSPRFTSYLAKQPLQVIKICGLMTIIHTVTNILSNLNLNLLEEIDQGLNLKFYNEIHTLIQQKLSYVITITSDIVDRAIYMHGFLYEQSERLLHLNTHQNNDIPQIKLSGEQLHKHLMREILMMRNFVILTNLIFSIPGISHVHRSLVKKALQQLVIEHLLLADYFVLTSTNRPIFCYIKRIPAKGDTDDQRIMSDKLRQHNLSLEEYMTLSTNYYLPKGNRLHESGEKILSMLYNIDACNEPYNRHINSSSTSIIRNPKQHSSYSTSNITSTHSIISNYTSFSNNKQSIERISDPIRGYKRSISPSMVKSSVSISTTETSANISNEDIQHSKRHINSIKSTSSEYLPDLSSQPARISDTKGPTNIDSVPIQPSGITSCALTTSKTPERKFFKTRVPRTIIGSTTPSDITD